MGAEENVDDACFQVPRAETRKETSHFSEFRVPMVYSALIFLVGSRLCRPSISVVSDYESTRCQCFTTRFKEVDCSWCSLGLRGGFPAN